MAQNNGYIKDSDGTWKRIKGSYMMSSSGSWSSEISDGYVQNYQYSTAHPNVDWRLWHDSNINVVPPTQPPSNLTLANALQVKTRADWQNAGTFKTFLYYQVVDAAGNEMDSGFSNRSITINSTDIQNDEQTWPSEYIGLGWRIRVMAQHFNDGGTGPFTTWTPSVTLRV